MENNLKFIKIIAITVTVVAMLAISYFIYNYIITKRKNDTMYISQQKITDARNAFDLGDFESAKAKYEDILSIPTDKGTEGKVKIVYASTLFRLGDELDKQKGVKMIIDVAESTSTPEPIRALAYTSMASFFVKSIDKINYVHYFNTEPYISFLPAESSTSTANKDMSVAYKKILELSDSVYPNSYAEYALAGDYYTPIVAVIATSSPEKIKEAESEAILIQDYVKKGDEKQDVNLYASDVYLRAMFYRAIALNASNRILNNLSSEVREDGYKRALDLALEEKNKIPASQKTMYLIRFWYANFLREAYGNSRNEDIKSLLSEFSKVSTGNDEVSNSIRLYFFNNSKNTSSPVYVYSLKLSSLSAEFKNFLINSGYSF